MRKMMLSLAVGALALSGCATSPPEPNYSNIDYVRVARIEAAARAVGVSVYWVNYPTRADTATN